MRHLRYFVAVAQERNFTRAAEKLNIAQPPLSRQILATWRRNWVSALLDRDSRPIRLTEAGRLFYEHATQVLEHVNDLRTMMRRFRDAERPRFVIGFVASTIYAALPAFDPPFPRRYAGARCQPCRDGEPRPDRGFGGEPGGSQLRPVTGSTTRRCGAMPVGGAACGGVPTKSCASLELLGSVELRRPVQGTADPVSPRAAAKLCRSGDLEYFRDRGLEPNIAHEARELQTAIGLGRG